jgi:hypothetical protein
MFSLLVRQYSVEDYRCQYMSCAYSCSWTGVQKAHCLVGDAHQYYNGLCPVLLLYRQHISAETPACCHCRLPVEYFQLCHRTTNTDM